MNGALGLNARLSCIALAAAMAGTGCHRAPSDSREPGPEPNGPATARQLVERARVAMGSELRLTAWTRDQSGALSAFDAVFTEFDRLENLMSVWRPGSDIVRLNAAAGQRPVPVSFETRDVLNISRQISEMTGGTFDVTFGALADLWKFDHDQDNSVPREDDIRQRLPLIDYRAVEVDNRAGTAFLRKMGMRVHLGGIGKGYAVDAAVKIMRGRGFGDFMIQAGGDMYVAGHRGNRPWRLGIRDPRGPRDQIFAALDLADGTFSTSGDYERFFFKNGRRYHHIIDLSTGQPAGLSRSVTLVTNRAVLADALAKGVFILGPDAGMALIRRTPDVEGVIVGADNQVRVSPGLEKRLTILAAPTDAP
jgi:thiamine biosynthesis lipoprotein